MTLPNIYSRRQRNASGAGTDVYVYDDIPNKVRVQVLQILNDGLGSPHCYTGCDDYWDTIISIIRREKGVFNLIESVRDTNVEFKVRFLNEKDISALLDGIEVSYLMMSEYVLSKGGNADRLIAELNARLQEAGVGYTFSSGQILRIDSLVLHNTVVIPALTLLNGSKFKTANAEYLKAHTAFREADYETAIVECGKSFESTLKIIGTSRSWNITPNDTASKLVAEAFNSGFIPAYMQSQFTALRSNLESGTTPIRNRSGAHGAGTQPRAVDSHLAAFQLHQTAAAIVFLVEHDRTLP